MVVLGAANVVRDAGLEAPYPYLWSLPARVRDADLGDLVGLLRSDRRPSGCRRRAVGATTWELDFSSAQAELDADYDEVDEAGKFTIYRLDRRMTAPTRAPGGLGVRRRTAALVLAGRHPQRPDRRRALALAARDLLAARLVLAVPEGLVAVAAGPRRLRPGPRRHRRLGFTPHEVVADPRRRVAGPTLGRRHRPDGRPPAPALRRPVRRLEPLRWYDIPHERVYASHFVAGLGLAGVLWLRNRGECVRWIRRYVTISYLALVGYIVFPMAPPWMAARDGLLPPLCGSPAARSSTSASSARPSSSAAWPTRRRRCRPCTAASPS